MANMDNFTVSDTFSSEVAEKCRGIEDILEFISKNGSALWKVRSTSKWFRRRYSLNIGQMKIRYEPSYKNNCFSGNARSYIDIQDVCEIRVGWKTDIFNKLGAVQDRKSRKSNSRSRSNVDENCCFSIIYGVGGKKDRTLDLVAPSSEVAEKWVHALRHLLSWYESKNKEEGYELWLRKQFNAADVDKNKTLTFNETMKLIRRLNIQMTDVEARILFNEANTKKASKHEREVLDEDEFIVFYFKLMQRPEIDKLFGCYSLPSGILTATELCKFLQKEQMGWENCTVDDCNELISIHEQSDLRKKGQMTASGFVNMLLSSEFDIFNKKHSTIYQDMSQPLSHYYIASSHNTYLLGNQLSGKSSVEGYVDALKRGCRCVELDCWDGDDLEPIIWHGYTFTTKIPFKEVIEDAIKPYAFESSKFPLILSIENHCSPPYQKKMAAYLKDILGEVLYTSDNYEDFEKLPSPRELFRKILVKAKKHQDKTSPRKLQTVMFNKTNSSTITQNTAVQYKEDQGKHRTVVNLQVVDYSSKRTTTNSERLSSANGELLDLESDDDEESSEESGEDQEDQVDFIDGTTSKKSKKDKFSVELSNLVNIIQAVKFTSFQQSKDAGKCVHMSSFGEAKATKLIEQNGQDFVDYNKRQLSRIYPGGTRTGSSNFDPIPFWTVGCQIVALNYQTEDISNLLNQAWFRENGGCGYVLKPEFLRNPKMTFDPKLPFDKNEGKLLKLRIISGQHLPKAPGDSEIVDPYVEIRVVGVPQDSLKKETKYIHNNGFNPVWDEMFEIRIRCPELAILGLRVRDYSQSGANMPLGYSAVPVTALSNGYRHVQLYTLKGEKIVPATLFVHVNFA